MVFTHYTLSLIYHIDASLFLLSRLLDMDPQSGDRLAAIPGRLTPDEVSEAVSERSLVGNDTASSKGTASPSKSLCSSTSTSAENIAGLDMKVSE